MITDKFFSFIIALLIWFLVCTYRAIRLVYYILVNTKTPRLYLSLLIILYLVILIGLPILISYIL